MLASTGTLSDAYDNEMAESFVDTFKTELIKDRVWRINSQLELAIVEYVAWYLHPPAAHSIGDRPPFEVEAEHAVPGLDALLDPGMQRLLNRC